MYVRPGDWESAWCVFETVQPLFALPLPWQADTSGGSEEGGASGTAIEVQIFVQCFSADMKSTLKNFPERRLSENESQSLFETLTGLLDFLENVVRVEEPGTELLSVGSARKKNSRADSVAESSSFASAYLASPLFSWWQTILPPTPSLDERDVPVLEVPNTDSLATLPFFEEDRLYQQGLTSFPKLEALERAIVKCQRNGDDLADTCRHLLSLKHSFDYLEDGQYRVSALVACLESLKRPDQSEDSSYDSNPTVRATQWDNREPWNTSTRLFGILRKRLLPCASHWAMLRLNGFEIEDVENLTPFKVYLSTCAATVASSTWKECSCTSVPRTHSKKGAFIADLCGALHSHRKDQSKTRLLNLRFDNDHLWNATAIEKAQTHDNAYPRVSLSSLLDSGLFRPSRDKAGFEQGDKAILALSLARCFLHLFTGPCMQRAWDSETIYFLQKDDEAMVVDIHSPYIKCSLSGFVLEPDLRSCQLMVISFARVLVEIETGKSIEAGIAVTAESADEIEIALGDSIYDLRNRWGLKHYVAAVNGCLSFSRSLQQERKRSPARDLSHLMAKVLYEQVVVHLESNMGLLPNFQQALTPRNLPLHRRIAIPDQNKRDTRTDSDISDRMDAESIVPDSPIDVLMDDSEEVVAHGDDKKATIARTFLSNLAKFNKKHIPRSLPKAFVRTRVCIIDTGLNLSDATVRGFKRRVVRGRSWVDDNPEDYDDKCGHGTHIARLLLTTSVHAEIIIAKVSTDKEFRPESIQHITSRAIQWAIENDADIISLSLGFHNAIPEIRDVLHEAISPEDDEIPPRIVFAAAGNWGLNYPRAFPSNEKGVFCVLASDGNGYSESINPDDSNENEDSFRTLGVAIESMWQGKIFRLSGTSYATPIAVGMAANVLDFAKLNMNIKGDRWRKLRSYTGMRAVLRLMTPKGNNQLYLCPWQLDARGLKTTAQIAKAFREEINLG